MLPFGLLAAVASDTPNQLKVRTAADGNVHLSWGLPGLFEQAGLNDALTGKVPPPVTSAQPSDQEMIRELSGPTGYPVTLTNGATAKSLLGYRVLRDGQVVSDLLQRLYFVTTGAGNYTVEAVYADGENSATNPSQIQTPTPTTDWLQCNIENVDISAYPRVSLRVTAGEGGLPFSAFSLEEEGQAVNLLQECFDNNSDQLLDICLVVDRSCYMNDYICAVASALNCIADDVPDCVDLKFSLVFYGNQSNGSSACGARYSGSPKHENQSELRTLESAAARLWEVGGYSLTGNQEPAYHAIQCGLNSTPWRADSRRLMILVSDANNDHCTWNGAIPQLSVNDLNGLFDEKNATFFAWCNYSVGCDCYDDCDSDRIPCDQWQDWGCNSGYTDFRPFAQHTGGSTVNICNDFWDLLDDIDFDGECEYTLCYDAQCCLQGSRRDLELNVDGSWHDCTDWGNYTINNCPSGSGHNPWINCWAANPTGFNPGEPVTVCVEAGDQDGPLASVNAHYSFGGCNETVAATNIEGNRWCVTIPGSCTNASGNLAVNFNARDACGNIARTECTITNNVCLPPDMACWSGNPETYNPRNSVTVCAVVRCAGDDHPGDDDHHDCNGDDDDDCDGDSNGEGAWLDGSGSWHDRDCDGDHENDHCDGDSNDDGDWRDSDWHWHDRHCNGHHGWWDDNDCDGDSNDDGDWQCHDGRWHDEDCDGDHDDHDGQDCPEVTLVTANYSIGSCNFTGEATRIEGNRYCVTVPINCLTNCDDLVVHFTALNECGEATEVSCTVICDTCVIYPGDYRTQTQGGWGQDNCNGGNVACIRNANFATCFPGGITLGSTFTARFTSSAAIATYLPRGTTPGILNQNYTNPAATTGAGIFLSQVLALGLNLGFADCHVPGFNHDLGPLEIIGGPFAGLTVDQLYALANQVLGGAGGLPGGTTLSQLNDAVDAINNNFDNGYCDRGYLRRICEPQNCPAPDVTCAADNLRHFLRGSQVVVYANVAASEAYTVSGRLHTFACDQTQAPVQVSPNRWAITIPGNCTWDNSPIAATFVVTNRCGVDSTTCEIPPCIGLEVHADPNNPANYTPGQPITVCANVTDADGDFGPETFLGHWWVGTPGNCENNAFGTCNGAGHCCVTIPALDCLNGCNDLYIEIMADDTCGAWDRDTIIVRGNNHPPVVTCWGTNPANFNYGQPLTVCAVVADPDNNVTSVTAAYNTGANCNRTVPATLNDGRWCVTIPDSCTRTCSNIAVTFTATDACGRTDAETCTINARTGNPTVTCWSGNPATFNYGQPLTVCVTAEGSSPIQSVTGSYNTGADCNTTLNATFNDGRWCITIPATCTQTCSNIAVSFVVTDACGHTRTRTCTINARTGNPTAECWTGNPTTFNYGQPLTMCVVAGGVNPVQAVTGSYNTGANCNRTVPAVLNDGRWCITIPDSCTRTCSNIAVNFTITDVCGRTATRTCTANSVNTPPVQACWDGNPANYQYGQSVNVCVLVNDAQNNVTGVTGQYIVGTCNATVTATRVEGNRWCITVPGSCTQTCTPLRVRFVSTDACGATDIDTCRVQPTGTAPVVNCYTGFPTTYTWGQPIQACVTINDPDNDVTGVTGSFNTGPGCNTTLNATFAEGRWCITIPATCTQVCGPIVVNWTATDACTRTGTRACTFTNIPRGPVVDCWPENPQHYVYGQALSMCALVNDPDNNVTGVTARFISSACDVTVPATFANGRWCATTGANCTNSCSDMFVIFTATDACGLVEDDTCRVHGNCRPPVVLCDDQNPQHYFWGDPITACALVGDPDGDLATVTARFNGANCDQTVNATPSGPGRYCATIPGSCTMVYGSIYVIFTATDQTGRTDDDTCYFYNTPRPPTVICWENNPSEYTFGTTVQMCAVATDPDNDIASVIAHVFGGSCDQFFPASSLGGGLYCFTIPVSCTQSNTAINVQFTVTDGGGRTASYNCPLNAGTGPCTPPYVICDDENSSEFYWGQPVTMCARVTDPDNDLTSVTAHYVVGGCDFTAAADHPGGDRYCVTIPGSCTQTLNEIVVTFTARDECRPTQPVSVTCTTRVHCTNPSIVCWDGNPNEFVFGAPLTACATVYDADADIVSVSAHFIGDQCDEFAETVPDGEGNMCITIPGACTESAAPISVIFRATDRCGLWAEVICVFMPPPAVDECCYMCTLETPALYQSEPIELGRAGTATAIKVENGRLRLYWQRVPEAEFYQIYCLDNLDDAPLTSIGFIPNNSTTMWTHPTPVSSLPLNCYFQVVPMRTSALQIPECGDRGRWEFNSCEGDVVPDANGTGWDAVGWHLCAPSCETEPDSQCADQNTGFAHFDGYVYTPDRCEEHYRVTNDTLWYGDNFQVWTRIRLAEEPTINSGPFYLVANASFDILGGGWALRIDPAWYTQNGTRYYHNRLSAFVWNEALNGGEGGWMTLQSPAPTPADPERWSVPVGEWSCVCMVVDGNQSLLIINGVVVAAGDLNLNSHNNLVPLMIGAGYRHNTYPIEYPYRGDMDCLRISDICSDAP
jgi:hypothetical protein